MVLVIGDAGQARVEGHHDEGELGQRAQQTSSVPRETRLQVKLYKRQIWRYVSILSRHMSTGYIILN